MREQALQAHAERLALDLARVGRADRGDAIGVVQAALEEGHVAVVLDPVRAERRRRQPEPAQGDRREHALVGEIVDRHHTAGLVARHEMQVRRRPARPASRGSAAPAAAS